MGSKSRLQRSKKKKKFISLRHHLTPSQTQHPIEPDELACLLEQDSGARTITDLFESTSSASSSSATFDQNEALSPVSPSIDAWDDGDGLARRALRGRERMVFCKSTKEVWCGMQQRRLSLKLDYEEILTAWSDRGSLYIDGEGPQVVPELLEDDSVAPNVIVDVGNSSGWRVPEMEVEEGSKRNREERVMRYKAKRQSRLFSKRIRYEVRKLNAEKRPRIKGRFVKRIGDMQGSSFVNNIKEDNCSY